MRTIYQMVCLIQQQHNYFQNPQTASVQLTPTPATILNLHRAGLWVKPTPNGLAVLRDTSHPAAQQPLPDFLFPLRFRMEPLSPYFANFTALAVGSVAEQPYRVRPLRLFSAGSSPTGVSELLAVAAPLLALTPLTLPVSVEIDSDSELQVWDVVRQQPLAKALARDNASRVLVDGAGQVAVDVRPWGSGHYQLRAGNRVVLDFYADEQLYAAQAWGVLEINLEALRQLPLTVQLTFEARRTRWRYLLRYQHPATEKFRAPPQSLSVTATAKATPQSSSPLPAMHFRQLLPAPPDTYAAFESEEAIALAERPGYTCALRCALPVPMLVTLLPAADSEVVRYGSRLPGATDPPAYSDIQVHL